MKRRKDEHLMWLDWEGEEEEEKSRSKNVSSKFRAFRFLVISESSSKIFSCFCFQLC